MLSPGGLVSPAQTPYQVIDVGRYTDSELASRNLVAALFRLRTVARRRRTAVLGKPGGLVARPRAGEPAAGITSVVTARVLPARLAAVVIPEYRIVEVQTIGRKGNRVDATMEGRRPA